MSDLQFDKSTYFKAIDIIVCVKPRSDLHVSVQCARSSAAAGSVLAGVPRGSEKGFKLSR